MSEKQIGVVIYTYDRIDDAKINMEIIRNVWSRNKNLQDVPIVHVFNGNQGWWPEKYLEDELLVLENTGHFSGCAKQIDLGINVLQQNYKNVSHVIILAADTWIMEPNYIDDVVDSMIQEEKFLATCGWTEPVQKTRVWRDVALDFFILDIKFSSSYSFFPIGYGEYIEKYGEIFGLLSIIVYVEQLVLLRFKQALLRYIGHPPPSENLVDEIVVEYIYLMKEREPITVYNPVYERKMFFPVLGLIGHHDPTQKQIALKNYKNLDFGKHIKKFSESVNLTYYNNSVTNIAFVRKGKLFKSN